MGKNYLNTGQNEENTSTEEINQIPKRHYREYWPELVVALFHNTLQFLFGFQIFTLFLALAVGLNYYSSGLWLQTTILSYPYLFRIFGLFLLPFFAVFSWGVRTVVVTERYPLHINSKKGRINGIKMYLKWSLVPFGLILLFTGFMQYAILFAQLGFPQTLPEIYGDIGTAFF